MSRLSPPGDNQLSRIPARELLVFAPILVGIGTLPWLFGGVFTSSQLLLAGCVATALLVRLVAWPEGGGALPLALVPLLLAIGLGAIQLWPLGDALATVSPRSHSLWQAAVAASPAGASPLGLQIGELATTSSSTISLYPYSTRRDLLLLSIAVAVFFSASQLLNRRRWQRLLFGIIAANGAVFAFFGIAQQLVWNGQIGEIYGRVPLTQGGSPFAAFVCRNNAGGYLNLCLAAAIGFALYAFNTPSSARQVPPHGTRKWADIYQRALAGVAKLDGQKLLALVMVILLFAGLLCTLSRGAWLSMLVSVAVVTAILAASRRVAYTTGMLVVVGALGFGLVDWLGRTDAIGARWKSLEAQFFSPTDGRLAHWNDGLHAASESWLVGSGLGTYRFIYRPYADTDEVLFYHAENQYIEAFCEAGILGLMLLVVAIVSMAFACRTLLLDHSPERRICGVVGTYALVSQAVHAMFDFGLYLPANMALFALICGAVAGAAAAVQSRASHRWLETVYNLSRRADLQAGFATLLGGVLLWGVVDLNKCMAVEAVLKDSQIASSYDGDSLASVTGQIGRLSTVLAAVPGHAEAQHELARLWVQRYRLRSFVELRSLAPAQASSDELWDLTHPLVVQGTVFRYAREGRTIELENLRRSESVQAELNSAARAVIQAIRGCALLPRAHMLLAELGPILAADPASAAWLKPVPFLAGGNKELLRECAVAQFQAGQIQEARATLRRIVELDPGKLVESLQLAGLFDNLEQVVQEIIPDSPNLLVEAAGSDYFRENERLRQALLDRAQGLLKEATLDPADRYRMEGSIHALMARDEQAIEALEKAVDTRPEMTAWRYELAALLQKHGEIDQAWEHARICTRMEPNNKQFDALLRELIRTRLSSR